MNLQRLNEHAAPLIFHSVCAPSQEDRFAHQAWVLKNTGRATEEELLRAAEYIPKDGAFVYIPEADPLVDTPDKWLGDIVRSYGSGALEHLDLKHPVSINAKTPAGGHYLVGYDETPTHQPVAGVDVPVTLALTLRELAYRLLYYPKALDDMQFGAGGSRIIRGEGKEQHVPVFHSYKENGATVIALSSLLERHHSRYTLYPTCVTRIPVSTAH